MKIDILNINKNTKRTVLVGLVVILFFVSIVFFYYSMVYQEKKDRIVKSGELAANQSATQFDKYLSTNVDLINLTAYALDGMIIENKPNSDIQDYLVGQSTAIKNAVQENYTGLYGYINGRFFSGTNWIPPEGYEPTKRPWYTKPMETPGILTVLEPYVDVQTGNTMLALGKTLCDGEGVISVDVSLDQFQKITEDTVSEGLSDIEMVLTGDGVVVTHSDINEVGKNYLDEKDTLGSEIASHIYNSDETYFELEYNGKKYIVYDAKFLGNWHCISVHDATLVFGSINKIFGITIAVIILIILILGIILSSSNRKGVAADRLSNQLSSAVDIYRSAHDIDIINDTFAEIVTNNKRISDIIGSNIKNAQKTLYMVMDKLTAPESKEAINKFIDFSTLDERLKDKKTISLEFLNVENLWLKGKFIVSQRRPDGKISHVLWLVEDINDEKRLRDELIDESQRAIAASEAKSSFLSNMSHEIRTPINAVLGMNEMILRECKDKNILSYSESVKKAGHNLLGIVNDILDFSKIEAGKLELITERYSVATVLCDMVAMIKNRASDKGLLFKVEIDKNIPRELYGDEIRIKQIIANILTNAVKYTEKGGIIFMVSYKKPEYVSDTILLNIAIKDTGIGIKENDIKKLFSEFERIEEKRNRNIEGTGLGMNITKSLLEMMGSKLQVESEYGRGSTFSFSLKQKVANWAPIGDFDKAYKASVEKHTVYKERIEAPDARVLVTDDNIMNLQVFAGLLKQTKIIIDTALSGDEAIALTMKNKYDIIFMDHMMPEKDGIETLHDIREQDDNPNCDTAVICLTANAISGAKEEYLNHGFDGYLSKPIDAGKLEDLLIKFLPDDKVNILGKEAEKTDEVVIPEIFVRLKEENLLDIDSGIKNSGSFDSFMSLLRIFYTSIDEKIEEIDTSFKENDINNYTIKVHALKSSARIVGANDIGEDAQLLENAGKEGNIDFIKDNHEYFLSKYKKFKDILKEVFDDDKDDKQKPEADPDLLDEVYKELKLAAENMDCDKLSAIFEEMEDYSIPESEKEKWNRLKTASDNYDYDEISEIIESAN